MTEEEDEWVPKTYPVPSHWTHAAFEVCFETVSTNGLKIPQNQYQTTGKYPVIDQGAVFIGGYTDDETKIISVKNPLLVFGDHTKCLKYVSNDFAPGADGIQVLKPRGLEPKFLYYLYFSLRLPDRGYSRHFSFLKRCKFPVAPLNEQRRIVDKIETLFADLDAGVESLTRARARLALYRQSVLKAAFEGRLTADWRAKNPDKLENPDTLLTRIKDERAARYKQALDDWQDAVSRWRADGDEGKKPSKPKRTKEVDVIQDTHIRGLPSLPEGWRYARIAQLAVVGTGITPLKANKAFYDPPEIPWVTSGVVNDFFVRSPTGMVSRKALEETNLRLYPKHTLLVALYGEGKTRGKCSELLFESATNQALAALEVENASPDLRDYLKYFLLKNYQDIRRLSAGGVQPNLNMGIIENQPVPLCSPAEQTEVVRALEAKLSNIDALEAQIDIDLARAKALRQSILKRAFAGRLVAQDPSDEPAHILLERIKGERNAKPKTKRRKK